MRVAVVSRWHQRLAELRGAHAVAADRAHDCVVSGVQNVQNVQNPAVRPTFEHSEQIEQPTVGMGPLARSVERAVANWSNGDENGAANVEYDGEVPRDWAEGFARLDPDRPPADVPLARWRCFIGDIGHFLDGGFATTAAALGWGSYDLFGADRDRPFARIDQAGLLWLLNGDRLIALSENTATIETRTCASQTFRRRPQQHGRSLAWELAR
jgi:hypothetical protein